MYSPNTIVYLLNTPLVMGDSHQIKFNSKADQSSYFSSKIVFSFTDNNAFTFQRKDNYIRIPKNIESLYNCNYVMYKNSQFSNKYFYAFITNMEYVNENVTNVYIKTDVFQTWQFDITFNKSFIERQHPATDNFNSIADTPAHGQLVLKAYQDFTFHGGYLLICNTDITQDTPSQSTVFNFSVGNFTIPGWLVYFNENEKDDLTETLQIINAKGYGDRITSCVYVPFLEGITENDYSSIPLTTGFPEGLHIKVLTGLSNWNNTLVKEFLFNFDFLFSGNVLTYKKSYCFPYATIRITDSTGESAEFSPEKFLSIGEYFCKFKLNGIISESPSYKIIPLNYCNEDLGRQNALTIRCNTSLPILNSQYAKYLMMNTETNLLNRQSSTEFANINSTMSAISGIQGASFGAFEGGAKGGGIGGLYGGFVGGLNGIVGSYKANRENYYTQQMITAQENQASRLPNQVSRILDDVFDRIIHSNKIRIAFYGMDDNHYKNTINYWRTFGYPVNTIETPNFNQNGFGDDFNFIKMISPNIEGGNVPNNDMREIETIFSSGITLWHNPETFKKY